MNIKSLTLKNKLVDEYTGEYYYDLTAPSFIYDANLGIRTIHYVMPDQVGRIDKISELYFGSGEYVDALCIVNNIFNPFSIDEGDILIIPNLLRTNNVYNRPIVASKPTIPQEDYINTGRQSEKDQSRIDRITEKAKTKESGVKNPLPPNMLQPGQDAKIYTENNIILGANLQSKSTINKS